jgi:hypothetical protein
VDLPPTLLELLGLPIPSDMQGISFAHSLHSPGAPGARKICHFENRYSLRPMDFAVRDARYKLLQYIKENYFGLEYGVDLVIKGRRWCKGAGASSTDRMVMYRHDENRIVTDITVPLMPVQTSWVPTQLSYLTPYVSQVGQVKFLYLQTIRYADGI